QLVAHYETGNGDDWNATDLRMVSETEETVRLAIKSDGFSAFALGVQRPTLELVDTELASESVAPGEAVRLEVTLSNVGSLPAEDTGISVRAIEADADDLGLVDAERVTVDAKPDETVTRTLTVELVEPGEYALIVDGNRVTEPEPVASFMIQEPESEPTDPNERERMGSVPNSAPETGLDDADDDNAGTPVELVELNDFEPGSFVGVAVLIVIVPATLFLFRRVPK
ncbi:hypothetical protein DJ68_02940, partial [Halorubrum sp. C3]